MATLGKWVTFLCKTSWICLAFIKVLNSLHVCRNVRFLLHSVPVPELLVTKPYWVTTVYKFALKCIKPHEILCHKKVEYLLSCHVVCSSSFVQEMHLHTLVVSL